MPAKRLRLDTLLVERGLAASRERARRLILAGQVWVNERRIDKVGALLATDAVLDVRGEDLPFVSRGGLKLAAALAHWNIDVRGMIAVDIGASTGGFTDCLLQGGAQHVVAIDVGYGQFAWKLRHDPRVTLFERTNIRDFDPTRLPCKADLATVDVSFISLRLVLPIACALVRPSGYILPLVKPQFEVGRAHVGKGGVVRDPSQHAAAVAAVRDAGLALGLIYGGECASPILGPRGNREFFLHFTVPAT